MVYLPPGYDPEGDQPYPSLYVHDGQDALEKGDFKNALDELIGESVTPLIAVFVVPDPDKERGELRDPNYSKMLVEELVPLIDGRYRTIDRPMARGTAGFVGGGDFSLSLAFGSPETFARVGAVWPTLFAFGAEPPTVGRQPARPLPEVGQLPHPFAARELRLGGRQPRDVAAAARARPPAVRRRGARGLRLGLLAGLRRRDADGAVPGALAATRGARSGHQVRYPRWVRIHRPDKVRVPAISFQRSTPMKTRSRFHLALTVLALCSLVAPGLAAQEGELATEDQKMLYALGLAVAQQVSPFGLTEAEVAVVSTGLADAALGREPKVDLQTYGPKLQAFAQARVIAAAAVEKGKSAEFVKEQAAAEGAMTTDSGLVYHRDHPRHRRQPGGRRHRQGPLPRQAARRQRSSTARSTAASRPRSRSTGSSPAGPRACSR